MHKLSYKTLFTILFFLLIILVVLLRFTLPKQKVEASWWNDSWNYRQATNISSHNTTESNVYITTTINIGTTTKAQNDDGDFRFISQSGDSLSYYIVSGVGTTNITFHIQIPNFPAGIQIIYAYYGSASAPNGFSLSDFSTQASNYTIGTPTAEETGGGPIAYWKFDEGTGTTAYNSTSITGLNGKLLSNASWASEDKCVSGKCVYIDDSGTSTLQTVQIVNNSNLNNLSAVTVSVWIKTVSNKASQQVVYQRQNITPWYSFRINLNNLKPSFSVINIGTTNNGTITANNAINLNQWYHIVGTYNGSQLKLFVNSVSATSPINFTGNLLNTNGPLLIGGLDTANTNYFNGYIDEAKIYNYARTPDQIKQDYNSRGSLNSSGANLSVKSSTAPDLNSKLVAYYKFDEGTGITAFDSSPQQKNAALVGATLPSWGTGKFNKGLDFNASGQRVVIGTTTPLSGQATTTLWYKRTSTASTSWRTLLGDKTANIHHLIINNSSRNIGIFDGSWRDFGYNPPDDNQFHHYAVIYDIGTSATLYVDGLYKNKIYTTLNLTTNPIGSIGNWNSGNYWAGMIDEVKIYNTALSADEIKQDYNRGSAIQMSQTTQTIGGTTTSLNYCIPGDTSYCASPIAEYNFEENTGTTTYDTSGNNNNGTFGTGNSAPIWTIGENSSGSGLKFSPGQYVNISNSITPTQYTASAWIKPSNVTGYDATYGSTIMATSSNYGLWLTIINGEVRFYPFLSNPDAGYGQTTGLGLNPNKWYFITVTATQTGNAKIYVNGIEKLSFTAGNTNWAGTLTIGDLRPGRGVYFNGVIDQIKIYNYARTPAQIAYDYNRGAPVGWWKLDECQGNIAHDSSGNNNNGTISIGSSGAQNSLGTCQIGTSAAWTNGASGKINSSLNFDGTDDFITINDSPSLDITNAITISAWINPTTLSSAYSRIIDKNRNSAYAFGIQSNQKALFTAYIGGSAQVPNTANTTIPINRFSHLVVTYDGSIIRYYLNGLPDGTAVPSPNGNIGTNNNPLYIGGSPYFPGQIDDVRVYNYTLTNEQVKQLYNGGALNFN